jgi:hypothetical protein
VFLCSSGIIDGTLPKQRVDCSAMLPELPFTITRHPDRVVISIHADAGQHEGLITEQSYSWIQGITGTVELDFTNVPQVNSLLVAWLFHLVQAGRLTSLVVKHASTFVVKQMKQFYLDRFVTITYAK